MTDTLGEESVEALAHTLRFEGWLRAFCADLFHGAGLGDFGWICIGLLLNLLKYLSPSYGLTIVDATFTRTLRELRSERSSDR